MQMRIAKHSWNITNALTLAVFAEPYKRRAASLLCPTRYRPFLKSYVLKGILCNLLTIKLLK